MTVEHTTSQLEECLVIYKKLGFVELDLESLGELEGPHLESPKGECIIRLVHSDEPTTVKHFVCIVVESGDKEFPEKLKELGCKFKWYESLTFGVKMPDGFLVKLRQSW